MEIREIHCGTIDSTNDYAKREYASFAPDCLTCIIADEQTAGHGRYHRKWVSPPHVNLYVTFSFFLPKTVADITTLGCIMAYSLASVLQKYHLHPAIKWPNDLLLNGKKVSGILCETLFQEKSIAIFLGIGINVNMGKTELDNIDQPATSLKQETGKIWDRSALLKELQQQFLSNLHLFRSKGFFPFHDPIEKLLAYRGEQIRCFDGQRHWAGVCHSLAPHGGLNLFFPDGTTHTIFSGDIE